MTDTNIEMTPAVRDRIERDAAVEQANATFEKLKADFEAHPEQRIARDRARLAELESDPFHLNKKIGGSAAAANEEQSLRSRIAVASEELAKLPGLDRIEHALTSDPASDPLIDSTVGGELPMAALRSQIADYRELGLDELSIAQAINGAKYPRNIIAQGKAFLERPKKACCWPCSASPSMAAL